MLADVHCRHSVEGSRMMEVYEHYVGKMMTTVSAVEDDDVYAVDDEVTLCMGLPMQQKL